MSLLQAGQFYWLKFWHPNRQDLISEGMGIAARFKRAKKYWQQHLLCSKEFFKNANEKLSSDCKSVLVLGAGRLFDLDIHYLFKRFQFITLVDGDPGAVRSWAKLKVPAGKKLSRLNIDLTSSLDVWTDKLLGFLRQKPALEKLPLFFGALQVNSYPELKADVVLSTNIMSQLSIHWRARVERFLKQYLGLETNDDGQFSPELEAALLENKRSLEQHHLQILGNSDAQLIVLTSDLFLLYYRRDLCHFREEKALAVAMPVLLENYSLSMKDSWWWHLAPQGIEDATYGCIHEVGAFAYSSASNTVENS